MRCSAGHSGTMSLLEGAVVEVVGIGQKLRRILGVSRNLMTGCYNGIIFGVRLLSLALKYK